jgi:alpha-beta hydrolase superfamily lysophospholipase
VHRLERFCDDGVSLHVVHYRPAHDTPAVGLVIFVHGLNEHCGRYVHLFQRLSEAGFGVHAYDAVGHGLSDAAPGRGRWNVAAFDELVDDLDCVGNAVLDGYSLPQPPVFLLGVSLGGLVAASFAAREKSQRRWTPAGMVLVAAALGVEWTVPKRILSCFGGCLSCLLPNCAIVPAAPYVQGSRDPEVVRQFLADPLNNDGPAVVRISREGQQAMRRLDPSRVTVPTLAIHGGADTICSLAAVRQFLDKEAATDKQIFVLPVVRSHQAYLCLPSSHHRRPSTMSFTSRSRRWRSPPFWAGVQRAPAGRTAVDVTVSDRVHACVQSNRFTFPDHMEIRAGADEPQAGIRIAHHHHAASAPKTTTHERD